MKSEEEVDVTTLFVEWDDPRVREYDKYFVIWPHESPGNYLLVPRAPYASRMKKI